MSLCFGAKFELGLGRPKVELRCSERSFGCNFWLEKTRRLAAHSKLRRALQTVCTADCVQCRLCAAECLQADGRQSAAGGPSGTRARLLIDAIDLARLLSAFCAPFHWPTFEEEWGQSSGWRTRKETRKKHEKKHENNLFFFSLLPVHPVFVRVVPCKCLAAASVTASVSNCGPSCEGARLAQANEPLATGRNRVSFLFFANIANLKR